MVTPAAPNTNPALDSSTHAAQTIPKSRFITWVMNNRAQDCSKFLQNRKSAAWALVAAVLTKKEEGGDRKEGRGAENKRETGYCYARGALDPSPFFFSLDRRRRRRGI